MTATERNALELIKRLVVELGDEGPVTECEGEIYCLLCGADMAWLPATGHEKKNCLWVEILSNASEQP